ncbi:hypothetical protein GGS23DRAFT_600270 [Durotheca rogersii]|uniref:uncharacterized protein n=1 Tax=Durotheca rogersii TaxID=419775 RepID=UPI00221EB660|nr:uncharacterized protein GGS23DRAFT_600270 [Durotheca rogersii]KAI5859569.1 hypothetical protein GGS23DRAFT_600270 [Durotheca rogersii]
MAPIRRYLRITKYSVIECRIYLDNPALVHTWLLNPRKPVLPKIIESVRPFVLPKLREERERSRKRSTKKKGIKDVVVEDDFEVSIFLTETSTRHALLTKHKYFHDTTQTKLTSNSTRLMGATSDAPVDVDVTADMTAVLREESDDDDDDAAATLAAIPTVDETAYSSSGRPPKRPRRSTEAEVDTDPNAAAGGNNAVEVVSDSQGDSEGADDSGLFVQQQSPEDDPSTRPPPAKRRRAVAASGEDGNSEESDDDKKKLAMDISYEGFSIYGRVLCLVVKRREAAGPQPAGRGGRLGTPATSGSHATKPGGGQAMMESFIISTQVPAGAEIS